MKNLHKLLSNSNFGLWRGVGEEESVFCKGVASYSHIQWMASYPDLYGQHMLEAKDMKLEGLREVVVLGIWEHLWGRVGG